MTSDQEQRRAAEGGGAAVSDVRFAGQRGSPPVDGCHRRDAEHLLPGTVGSPLAEYG